MKTAKALISFSLADVGVPPGRPKVMSVYELPPSAEKLINELKSSNSLWR